MRLTLTCKILCELAETAVVVAVVDATAAAVVTIE